MDCCQFGSLVQHCLVLKATTSLYIWRHSKVAKRNASKDITVSRGTFHISVTSQHPCLMRAAGEAGWSAGAGGADGADSQQQARCDGPAARPSPAHLDWLPQLHRPQSCAIPPHRYTLTPCSTLRVKCDSFWAHQQLAYPNSCESTKAAIWGLVGKASITKHLM